MDENEIIDLISRILRAAPLRQAVPVLRELESVSGKEGLDEADVRLISDSVRCASELRSLIISGIPLSREAMEAVFSQSGK